MALLDALHWRYATKKFDSSRKISPEKLLVLKKAIQLAPTSYGLQLFKVVIIESQAIKEQLPAITWGQIQVKDASHVFVFTTLNDDLNPSIDNYVDRCSNAWNQPRESLNGYSGFIKKTIDALTPEERKSWLAKQAYIVASHLLIACAELQIDSCPMEGFDAAAYDKLLALDQAGLQSVLVVPVGFRHADDANARRPKVRRGLDELFINA